MIFKTHTELGRFKNEKQYGDYLEKLLIENVIQSDREYRFEDQSYSKDGNVRCIVDFIIDGKIVLEFKAKKFIEKNDYFQVKRYLTTLNLELGILVNFRQERLSPKRILNSDFVR